MSSSATVAKCWCSSASGKDEPLLPALVLTAGLGTRLDPITRLLAKAAVPLAGRTLIERSLARLAAQDVRDAVLNLHHHPETVTSIVGDGSQLGLRVRYSWEPIVLGSAGGPRRALPLMNAERFLIINGDTLCDVDLAEMVRFHAGTAPDVTMAVVANPAPNHYNGIRLDDDGRITGFVPKGPAAVGSWHFIGVQVVEARIFEALPDGVPAETVWGIYKDLLGARTGGLRGFRVNKPFIDVGTARDYLTAALALAGPEAANSIEPGADVSASARLFRTVVWGNAVIGADAALTECVVAGVTVPSGFSAEGAVLVPAAVVRPDDQVTITGGVAAFPINQ